MLPVYGNDGYRNISGTTPEELIEIILDAQDDEGFFWADAKAESYSIPLTSRALLALIPYNDDEMVDKKVSDEVAEATAAVLMALAANEGFANAKGAFDVYDVQAVKRPETSKTATKASIAPVGTTSGYRSPSAAKTIPQSGDETLLIVGFASSAALFGLAAALIARRRIRES